VTIGGDEASSGVEFTPAAVVNPGSLRFLLGAISFVSDQYLNSTLTVQNLSGSTIKNLTMVAMVKPGNLFDTALSAVVTADGMPVPGLTAAQIRAIKPTHGMTASGVNVTRADLQFFRQSEIDALAIDAGTTLNSNEYLLNYGFLVKNSSGGTTLSGTGTSRLTNRVMIGLKLPSNLSNTNRYTLTYLLFTVPNEVKTQSVEDNAAMPATVAGQLATSANISALSQVRVLENSSYSGLNRVTVCNVRTAGSKTIPIEYLAPASNNPICANEPPKFTIPTPVIFNIPENSPNGSPLGSVAAVDVERGSLSYSIFGANDANRNGVADLAINSTTAALSINDKAVLDYEARTSLNITVRATDSGMPPQHANAGVTLNISDVPEGIVLNTISAGGFHTCGLGTGNYGVCWGQGGSGQLGFFYALDFNEPEVFPTPSMTTNWKHVAAGLSHTCAIASDDKAYCWGNGADGRLGNGQVANETLPNLVDSALPTPVKSISAGHSHTCAIGSDDKAYCWGNGSNGRLGDGNIDNTNSAIPVAVNSSMPTPVKSITAGGSHTCAIASDGGVDKAYCWGNGDSGRLGRNSTTSRNTPGLVNTALPTPVKQISAGGDHTCAIGNDSKAYCWGADTNGQVGDSLSYTAFPFGSKLPVEVTTGILPATVKSISAGHNHSCAIGSDNKAYCWGSGAYGQLGNNSNANTATPTAVIVGTLPTPVQAISAGGQHSCAIGGDSKGYCWGYGENGQLGDGKFYTGSPSGSLLPVQVNAL
jgi:alpha-tubulin suppressor-like RCC1 family protein